MCLTVNAESLVKQLDSIDEAREHGDRRKRLGVSTTRGLCAKYLSLSALILFLGCITGMGEDHGIYKRAVGCLFDEFFGP